MDFKGINHYSTLFVKDCLHSNCTCMHENNPTCSHGENHAILGFLLTSGQNKDGEFIGDLMGMPGLYVVPQGMEDIIDYIKKRYNNMPIFVTENGYGSNDNQEGGYDLDKDINRIKFHKAYLASLARSIRYFYR
uniref:Beta-glucosidase n=1 Tax=Solanum tuberosum TaxID=4113 RepID=M1DG35_SOLTU